MACAECGDDPVERVEIEYANGSNEELDLCVDCQTEFEKGGFVREVSHVDG